MLRIFGHFLPVPTLILGISEGVILTVALNLVAQPAGHFGLGFEPDVAQFSVVVALLALVAMMAVGLYDSDAFLDYRVASARMVFALTLVAPMTFAATLVFGAISYMPEQFDSHWRLKAAVAWLFCLVVTRTIFLHVASLEIFKQRVLVLGSGTRAAKVKALAEERARARFIPVIFFNACGDQHLVNSDELPVDEALDRTIMARKAREVGAREIVIATDDRRGLPVHQLVECRLSGIAVTDYVAFCERETGRVDLDALQPSWFIFSDGFRMGPVSDFIKRSFDLIVSSLLLITVLPILVCAAIAIKYESVGPILFRQERVGLRGQRFVLLKFRSMRVDAERDGSPKWAQKNDPRVTRVGMLIRKVRIDELPQLFNVLRGDMSFVGPRPERPFFVDSLAQNIPFYSERHTVRPGISGWAQVNYPYGASVEDARQKLSYDLYYLKNRSIFLDLVVLIQTVRVVLWPEGAR